MKDTLYKVSLRNMHTVRNLYGWFALEIKLKVMDRIQTETLNEYQKTPKSFRDALHL